MSPERDFNPRAPCGARQGMNPIVNSDNFISTHAPLAGRDVPSARSVPFRPYFNPRAPCGARRSRHRPVPTPSRFQPTRPLRGATQAEQRPGRAQMISTHAPLAGRDTTSQAASSRRSVDFNPRAPCGARLVLRGEHDAAVLISTHAPLAGRDQIRSYQATLGQQISTHAPLAGRDQLAGGRERDSAGFQPTRPLRGATVLPLPRPVGGEISTHAPLAGRDCLPVSATTAGELDFNPRAPCGARRHRGRRPSHQEHFNPRAPCGARQRPRWEP